MGGVSKAKIKRINLGMKKILNVPISKSLLNKMSNRKKEDLIEVRIFLNNETEDKDYIGFSGGGNVNIRGNSHLLPMEIEKRKKSTFSDSLIQLHPAEQAKRADTKLSEIREDFKKDRIELAEKIFNEISVKLHSVKLDYNNFNKSAGILNLKLSKSDILKLSKYPVLINSIDIPRKKNLKMESAFNEIKLNTTAHPVSKYGGDSIGIYMTEEGCFSPSDVEPILNIIGLSGGGLYDQDQSEDQHANVVAQALRMTSHKSHIYCSDNTFSIPNHWKDNVQIVNYSWAYESETPIWTSYDTSADMHAYNDNVQLFISAGNECNDDEDGNGVIECIVDSPAKSHNSLTVGSYNDSLDSMADFSDWNTDGIHIEDSSYSDYIKPEILAPGAWLTSAGLLNEHGQNIWSGTSFSSPMAAGMAASMLSTPGNEGMRSSQALIKAAVIAMASKDDISDNGLSKRDGASAIQWNPYISWRWWDYSNSFLDAADGQWMELDQRYLYSGHKYKAILSWSNRTDRCDGKSNGYSYDGPDDLLCMDLDFKVVDPHGNIKIYSSSYSNNFEGGEFTANISGNYKFYVNRYRNTYEWTRSWFGGKKTYHKNRAKLGLAVARIVNE